MKKILLSIFFMLILCLYFSSFVSADSIDPTRKYLSITNIITNINDYPDYEFYQVGSIESMCSPTLIDKSTGEIISRYKLCSYRVYAIKRSDLEEIKQNMEYSEFEPFIKTSRAILVLEGLITSISAPLTSIRTDEIKYFEIKFSDTPKEQNQQASEPVKVVSGPRYMLYFYIFLIIIAVILIYFKIYKKKSKNKK